MSDVKTPLDGENIKTQKLILHVKKMSIVFILSLLIMTILSEREKSFHI